MDADKHTITVTPLDRTATVGKVPELWLITPMARRIQWARSTINVHVVRKSRIS